MTLYLDTLESGLWEFTNILRGAIDSSDFNNYIFGLLFLKRFNDVFEERVRSYATVQRLLRHFNQYRLGAMPTCTRPTCWATPTNTSSSSLPTTRARRAASSTRPPPGVLAAGG